MDENQQLSETFRVPDLKTGRMVRLITQLTPKEEEMFRNMVRRMNNLCRVSIHDVLTPVISSRHVADMCACEAGTTLH